MKLTALFCDWCGEKNVTPATDHIVIRSGKGAYSVDLCDAHHTKFFKGLAGPLTQKGQGKPGRPASLERRAAKAKRGGSKYAGVPRERVMALVAKRVTRAAKLIRKAGKEGIAGAELAARLKVDRITWSHITKRLREDGKAYCTHPTPAGRWIAGQPEKKAA
jgi:hypothetical protein